MIITKSQSVQLHPAFGLDEFIHAYHAGEDTHVVCIEALGGGVATENVSAAYRKATLEEHAGDMSEVSHRGGDPSRQDNGVCRPIILRCWNTNQTYR